MRLQGNLIKKCFAVPIALAWIVGIASGQALSTPTSTDGRNVVSVDAPREIPAQAEASTALRRAEGLFVRGAREEQRGDADAAERSYRECLHIDRQHGLNRFRIPSLHRLAVIKAKAGQFDESETLFRDALPDCEQNVPFLCDLAKLYTDLKRYREAETVLKNIVLLVPDDRRALYNLGYVIALQQDRQTEGLRYFKLALGEKEAFREVAKIYRLRGNENQAEFAEQRARMVEAAGPTPPGIETLTPEGRREWLDQIKKELFLRESARMIAELQKLPETGETEQPERRETGKDGVAEFEKAEKASANPWNTSYAEMGDRQFASDSPTQPAEAASGDRFEWILPSVEVAATTQPTPGKEIKMLPNQDHAKKGNEGELKIAAIRALPSAAPATPPTDSVPSIDPTPTAIAAKPPIAVSGTGEPFSDAGLDSDRLWNEPAVPKPAAEFPFAVRQPVRRPPHRPKPETALSLPNTEQPERTPPRHDAHRAEVSFRDHSPEALSGFHVSVQEKPPVRLIDVRRPPFDTAQPGKVPAEMPQSHGGDSVVNLMPPREAKTRIAEIETPGAVRDRHRAEAPVDPSFKLKFVRDRRDSAVETAKADEARLAFRPVTPDRTGPMDAVSAQTDTVQAQPIASNRTPQPIPPTPREAFEPIAAAPQPTPIYQGKPFGGAVADSSVRLSPKNFVPALSPAERSFDPHANPASRETAPPENPVVAWKLDTAPVAVSPAPRPSPVYGPEPAVREVETARTAPDPKSVLETEFEKHRRSVTPEIVVNTEAFQTPVAKSAAEPKKTSVPETASFPLIAESRTRSASKALPEPAAPLSPPEPSPIRPEAPSTAQKPEAVASNNAGPSPESGRAEPFFPAVAWAPPAIPLTKANREAERPAADALIIGRTPTLSSDRSTISWRQPEIAPRPAEPATAARKTAELRNEDRENISSTLRIAETRIVQEETAGHRADVPPGFVKRSKAALPSDPIPFPAAPPEPYPTQTETARRPLPGQTELQRAPQTPSTLFRPTPMPVPTPKSILVRDEPLRQPVDNPSETRSQAQVPRPQKPVPMPMPIPEPEISDSDFPLPAMAPSEPPFEAARQPAPRPGKLAPYRIPEPERDMVRNMDSEHPASPPMPIGDRETAARSVNPAPARTPPVSVLSPQFDISQRVEDIRRERTRDETVSVTPRNETVRPQNDENAGFATSRRGIVSEEEWTRHQRQVEQEVRKARADARNGSEAATEGGDVGFARSGQYSKSN